MQILTEILKTLPDGEVADVRIGLHWTAVVVRVDGGLHCGLASTLSAPHTHGMEPSILQAGRLAELSASELAVMALQEHPVRASLGLAAINALLAAMNALLATTNALLPQSQTWVEENAEDLIARLGAGKRVVLVGHFPFVPALRPRVGELIVLEQNPGPGDLPAEDAGRVIPKADLVAITAMTIANRTLDGLLRLRSPHASAILLGPSTPLSPLFFDYGIDVLSGAVVTDIDAVLRAVSQGAGFRQVHRAGVRLLNIIKPNQTFSDIL